MGLDIPPRFDPRAQEPDISVVATLKLLRQLLDQKRGLDSTYEDACGYIQESGYRWDLDDEVERSWCVQWLTRSVEWATKRLSFADDPSGWVDIMDTSAGMLSELCGKGASGPVRRQVKVWGKDGNTLPDIMVHEPSFVQADVGCLTWGAAILFARKIARGDIDVSRYSRCLELGCGTGLLGLMAARAMQERGGEVVMTDYLPSLLDAVRKSATDNGLIEDGTVRPMYLDWFKVAKRRQTEIRISESTLLSGEDETKPLTAEIEVPKANYTDVTAQILDEDLSAAIETLDPESNMHKFDLVIAADVLYEVAHAKVIPMLADYFLSLAAENTAVAPPPRFIMVAALRSTHWEEVRTFEREIAKIQSLNLISKDEITLSDDLVQWAQSVGLDLENDTDIAQKLKSDMEDKWEYRTYIFERQ